MKNSKKRFILLCTLIVCVGFSWMTSTAFATEGAGGQVIRDGKISFYEESTESSSSTSPSTSEEPVKKPIGRIPSLGEIVQNYGLFGVGLLLMLFLFLFLRKFGKEKQK